MSDYKDILGLPGGRGGADGAATTKARAEKQKQKRPEGMSREAFALLGDSHPILSAQELLGPKKKDKSAKPKPSTKGIVTWGYKPFKSSARPDGLELKRWSKGYKDAAGRLKEPEDVDYYFAKFNKKVQVWKYDDEEYETLIRPVSGDWSREETDYLMELAERLDLRFVVMADRYEFVHPTPGAPPAPPRTMEDLKSRYYTIARRLLVAREGGEAPVANDVLVKHPYSKEHDLERKRGIELMQTRTREELQDEMALIAEARQIEEERRVKAEAAAAAAAAAAAPALDPRFAAGGAGMGGYPGGGPHGMLYPESFPADPGPGMPSLFTADLRPVRPAPGVYARGSHALMAAITSLGNLPGGQKAQKAVEQTLLDLAWPQAITGPKVSTRPVCAAWLALRAEVLSLQELRRATGRYADTGGGGGSKKKSRR